MTHSTPTTAAGPFARALDPADLRLPRIAAADITKIRTRENYTQEEMARILNCTLSTLSKWERGVLQPSGAAQRLLQLLGTHGIAGLFGGANV